MLRWRPLRRDAHEWIVAPRGVQALRIVWCMLILYVERLAFARAAGRCRIPAPDMGAALNVLVVTDPQIVGRDTYEDALWILWEAARFFSDQYLRKAWRALQGRGLGASLTAAPPAADVVVMLGDMSDRGRWYTSKERWAALQARWHTIFSGTHIVQGGGALGRRTTPSIPALVVPGNHDIGLPDAATGLPTAANKEAAAWFADAYAPRVDDAFRLANTSTPSWNARIPVSVDGATTTHELVLVNALDLVSMQPLLSEPFDAGGTRFAAAKARAPHTTRMIDLLDEEAKNQTHLPPRILFSHVPLSRGRDEHSCDVPWRTAVHGVRRESHRAPVPGGDILQGGDLLRTYQNLVQPEVSEYVLGAVQPALLFSGDDHDHCEAVHHAWRFRTATHGSVPGFGVLDVPELTVKSISMLEGVHRPGYAWLQLSSTNTVSSMEYTPCLLPDQVALWLYLYVPLFLLTLVLGLHRSMHPAPRAQLLPSHEAIPMERLGRDRRRRPVDAFAPSRLARLARVVAMVGVAPLPFWVALQH